MLAIICTKYELSWIRNVTTPKLSAQKCNVLGAVLTKSSPNDLWYKGQIGISLHTIQLMLATICANFEHNLSWSYRPITADHRWTDRQTLLVNLIWYKPTVRHYCVHCPSSATQARHLTQRTNIGGFRAPALWRHLGYFSLEPRLLTVSLPVFTPDEQSNEFKDKTSYHYSLTTYPIHVPRYFP